MLSPRPLSWRLEVDPADGTLLMATHSGLYRVRKDRIDPTRSRLARSDVALALQDLEIDPADPAGGARIVWPASEALFRTDLDGRVSRSSDGGLTWEDLGRVDGATQGLTALDERTLYAADLDGVVRVSRHGGRPGRNSPGRRIAPRCVRETSSGSRAGRRR